MLYKIIHINTYSVCVILRVGSLFLDDNECENPSHGCSHQCTNTPGSFVCSCNDGYELDEDGNTCNLAGVILRTCIHLHTPSSICMRGMLLHHNNIIIMKHYQNISESPCFHVYVRTSETGTFNVTSCNGDIQCVLPVTRTLNVYFL